VWWFQIGMVSRRHTSTMIHDGTPARSVNIIFLNTTLPGTMIVAICRQEAEEDYHGTETTL
jgi:hypothetical protein